MVSEKNGITASGQSGEIESVRTNGQPISRPNASRPTASCSESSGSMSRRGARLCLPPSIPDTSGGPSKFHRVVVSTRPTESSVKTHPPPPMFLRCCCWAPCLTTVCRPIIRPAGPLARVEAALRAANMVLFPCGAAVGIPICSLLPAFARVCLI